MIVPVSYHDEWQDGLGARGWKLDYAIGDPVILAVTAHTGGKVPTSVLVHDILDHLLCGFGPSGHRNEAKATWQLGLRTGAEIDSSYTLLAQDIMANGINGESLESFLPETLCRLLPEGNDDRQRLRVLIAHCGSEPVKAALIERLREFGRAGVAEAQACWQHHGLDYTRHAALGLCLQHLLEWGDALIESRGWREAHAHFRIANTQCALVFDAPETIAQHSVVPEPVPSLTATPRPGTVAPS